MLLVELCVSQVRARHGRRARRGARSHRRRDGQPRPAGASVRATRSAPIPGKLRIGLLTHNPLGTGEIHPDCVAAAREYRAAARVTRPYGGRGVSARRRPPRARRPVHDALDRDARLQPPLLGTESRARGNARRHGSRSRGRSPRSGARPRPPTTSTRSTRWASSAATSTRGSARATTCCSPRRSASHRASSASSRRPTSPFLGFIRAATFVPYTPLANMAGTPAISLPLSWNEQHLPIGSQLMGAYGREDLLLRVASQLETRAPWADRTPPVHV